MPKSVVIRRAGFGIMTLFGDAAPTGVATMRRLASFVGVLTVTGFVALGPSLHSVAQDKQKTPRPQFAAAAGSPVAVGPMAQKVLVADMNGDGNPDIVLTCGGTTHRADASQVL